MKRIDIKAFAIFFFVLSILHAQNNEILVTIDNIVREIGAGSSCSITDWAHKLENSCMCCLVKKVPLLKQQKITALTIVEECIAQQLCDVKTINDFIKQNLGQQYSVTAFDETAEETLKKLLFALYEKSIVIKEVEPPGTLTFDSYGNFTEKSLADFLVQAYQDKKLNNSDFAQIKCIETKNLVGHAPPSAFTSQLFLVTSKCSTPVGKKYILKDLKLGQTEASRLAILASKAEIKDIQNKSGFPVVIFPEAYLSYSYNGKKHTLSLMPKAEGITFSDFTENYGKNPSSVYLEKLVDAYKKAGTALGNFHKHFMGPDKGETSLNTVRHADLHRNNIFYDESTGTVSFIDNETMMQRFNERDNAIYDVHKLIYSLLSIVDILKLDSSAKRQVGVDLLTAFLESYINVFGSEKAKKHVFNTIVQYFQTVDKGEYARYKQIVDDVLNKMSGKFDVA